MTSVSTFDINLFCSKFNRHSKEEKLGPYDFGIIIHGKVSLMNILVKFSSFIIDLVSWNYKYVNYE